MEIAINSIVLFFILVFPGIVFRRFYYVGEFSKQFNATNWLNSFYISLVPGILVQIISFYIFSNFLLKELDIKGNYDLLNNIYHTYKSDSIPKEILDISYIKWILIYFLINIIVAGLLAQFFWIIVRSFDLDIKFKPLRFNNYWYYYFSGECLKFKDFKNKSFKKKIVALTEADILVDLGNEGTKLYKGFIRQHTICKNTGDLKNIYLTEVRRYTRNDAPNHIKVVPGNIMIIPKERIININLTYVLIDKQQKFNKQQNLFKTFFNLLNLIVLLILMYNPSDIILRNTNLWGDITGRIWLFLGWMFIVVFIQTCIDLCKEGISIDKRIQLKNSIKGTLIFITLITLIIYMFYYK